MAHKYNNGKYYMDYEKEHYITLESIEEVLNYKFREEDKKVIVEKKSDPLVIVLGKLKIPFNIIKDICKYRGLIRQKVMDKHILSLFNNIETNFLDWAENISSRSFIVDKNFNEVPLFSDYTKVFKSINEDPNTIYYILSSDSLYSLPSLYQPFYNDKNYDMDIEGYSEKNYTLISFEDLFEIQEIYLHCTSFNILMNNIYMPFIIIKSSSSTYMICNDANIKKNELFIKFAKDNSILNSNKDIRESLIEFKYFNDSSDLHLFSIYDKKENKIIYE